MDERTLFNENYDSIPTPIYGWFQFEFAKRAFSERADHDFESLITDALGQ